MGKVNQARIQKQGVVHDVAQSNVEVPVHALQRADNDAVFRGGYAEKMPAQVNHASARRQRSGDGGLLPGLSQATGMNLHELGQSRYNKIPLVREAISPAAVGERGTEARTHDLDHFVGIGVRIQVQIAPEVRPVIEGLDYGYWAARVLQRNTDPLQKLESVMDACG